MTRPIPHPFVEVPADQRLVPEDAPLREGPPPPECDDCGSRDFDFCDVRADGTIDTMGRIKCSTCGLVWR